MGRHIDSLKPRISAQRYPYARQPLMPLIDADRMTLKISANKKREEQIKRLLFD
jgi:hypothetical protein